MRWIPMVLCLLVAELLQAQPNRRELETLQAYELKMAEMADSMNSHELAEVRIRNAYLMITMVKNALLIDGSWHYPFNSLYGVSVLYPPDSTFRIFTWQLQLESGQYRHFGALQYPSDKKLRLTPLIDASNYMMHNVQDTIVDNNHWYGAVYYNIIQRTIDSKPYYFLFGFDANDPFSKKKVLDVLHFTAEGTPLFGSYLIATDTTDQPALASRFVIEYAGLASASLNYDAEMDMILFDHLEPANGRSEGVFSTYIPDGTYEGFVWNDDHWKYVEKVFEVLPGDPDNPPVPDPVDFDAEQKAADKEMNRRMRQSDR